MDLWGPFLSNEDQLESKNWHVTMMSAWYSVSKQVGSCYVIFSSLPSLKLNLDFEKKTVLIVSALASLLSPQGSGAAVSSWEGAWGHARSLCFGQLLGQLFTASSRVLLSGSKNKIKGFSASLYNDGRDSVCCILRCWRGTWQGWGMSSSPELYYQYERISPWSHL